ncbi:MAG: hypothetical protein Ct9H90mP30_0250 [Actinomycetota bacterium]|nr:MAG: hypothetical protein Ct9H90mP30_0250 [Actinomycetota bacterium]
MPAGQSQVTVQIETIDDDVLFLPGDMVVASWPARIGTVSVDDGSSFSSGNKSHAYRTRLYDHIDAQPYR